MGEWEVIEPFDGFQTVFVVFALEFFILQYLIGLDEGIDLVGFIFLLIEPFFVHLLSLELQEPLLVLTILDLVNQLSVSFLVNLVDNLY